MSISSWPEQPIFTDSARDYARELREIGQRQASLCNCVGRQGAQPVCPCRMGSVSIENGRYIQRIDLGPAPKDAK